MNDEKKLLILVVDDFHDNRDMYAQFLSYAGFAVALAGDGQEALDKASRLVPDLIVMDLSLPVMNGWEAIRQLKKNDQTKHIPIIALTAHTHQGVAEETKAAGCDGFITKPCPPEELVKEIVRMLERKDLRKTNRKQEKIQAGAGS